MYMFVIKSEHRDDWNKNGPPPVVILKDKPQYMFVSQLAWTIWFLFLWDPFALNCHIQKIYGSSQLNSVELVLPSVI